MENQIKELATKAKRLKPLIQELEKKIVEQEKNTDKKWLTRLEAFRGDAHELILAVEGLFKVDKELTEKEGFTYKEGSFKKIRKFEKKKKQLSNNIKGLGDIIENFEFNLKWTISQLI